MSIEESTEVKVNSLPIDPVGINIINAVSEALEAAGHPDSTKWIETLDRLDKTARSSPDLNYQRFMINRTFNYILMQTSAVTHDVRSMLINDGPIHIWLSLFKNNIAKRVVALGL